MKYRAAALQDSKLRDHVRSGLLSPEAATKETLAKLTTSEASIAHAEREVRLEERTKISDQGSVGSCYANAWCDAMEMLQPAGHVVQLSRMFAWYNARLANGDQARDEGTFGAIMSSRQRTLGVCREDSWPYDGSDASANARAFVRPPLLAYQEAYDHRAGVSFVLPKSFSLRAQAALGHLDKGYPIVVALAVSDAWDDPGDVLEPPGDEEITGYHAVMLDGYVRKSDGTLLFDVRNSWGEDWGRKGHVYVPASYLAPRTCDRADVITLSPDFGGPS